MVLEESIIVGQWMGMEIKHSCVIRIDDHLPRPIQADRLAGTSVGDQWCHLRRSLGTQEVDPYSENGAGDPFRHRKSSDTKCNILGLTRSEVELRAELE